MRAWVPPAVPAVAHTSPPLLPPPPQNFVNYGLDHWGSDQAGVNHTRRFLLEWLSFLHRYVPAGLLEVLPQRVNDRPPPFVGRDDLETLMASPAAEDWVAISEMLLGKVPPGFRFLPKHKSNSYGGGGGSSGGGSGAGSKRPRAPDAAAPSVREEAEGDDESEVEG